MHNTATLLRKALLGAFAFLCPLLSLAQTTILGQITDAQDHQPIPGAMVAVYIYNTQKIIGYGQSNEQGQYRIKLTQPAGALTLKARHISYRDYSRDIALGEDVPVEIPLSFTLQPKTQELKEVEIVAKPSPILVKKDTIIYQVEHWAHASDQSLEDVLKKIPGFKLQGSSITVNGEQIQKVLIDGQQVHDLGSAMLTRTITPDMVKSVEVRFDEQDKKLKGLLDQNKMAVLDIKLKEGVSKRFFGKAALTAGYRDTPQPGGYLNAFSLGQRAAVQLLAESDRFGMNTFKMDDIHNIGFEAFMESVQMPASVEALQQRPTFQEDVYGVRRAYTRKDLDLVGLSVKREQSERSELYLASFVQRLEGAQQQQQLMQFVGGAVTRDLQQYRSLRDLQGKHQLKYRYMGEQLQFSTDLNLVHGKPQNTNLQQDPSRYYDYNTQGKGLELYYNSKLEYKPSQAWGMSVGGGIGWVEQQQSRYLQHNDPLLPLPSVLRQQRNDEGLTAGLNPQVQWRHKRHSLSFKIPMQLRLLQTDKIVFMHVYFPQAYEAPPEKFVYSLQGFTPWLQYQEGTPQLAYHLSVGSWNFNLQGGGKLYRLPSTPWQATQRGVIPELSTRAAYKKMALSMSIGWTQKSSPFPLEQLTNGYDLLGFNMLGITGRLPLRMTTEQLTEVQLIWDNPILQASSYTTYGRSNRGQQFDTQQAPLISTIYNQLASRYYSQIFVFNKSLNTLEMELDIVLLDMRTDNQGPAGLYQSWQRIYSFPLTLHTLFKEQPFNLSASASYQQMHLGTSLDSERQQQEQVVGELSGELLFFDKLLIVKPSWRSVFIRSELQHLQNHSLDVELRYARKKTHWFVHAGNLLDNRNFLIQQLTPAVYTADRLQTFGRFVRVGMEWRIK